MKVSDAELGVRVVHRDCSHLRGRVAGTYRRQLIVLLDTGEIMESSPEDWRLEEDEGLSVNFL